MAKQLYDYWFMQFNFPDENGRPYKSSGGAMAWNEKLKREIPKDWYVKSIGEFANVRKGTTITKAQTQNGSVKVVAAATSFSFLHNEANRSEYVITISSSGANAGYINFWREPIFASDCSTVQGNSIEITLYCYCWLLYFQETLFNQQIGAAQPHVYPEHISKIPIVIPPNHILNKIKDCMISINMQQHMIEQEIEELAKQRNELLPLLMNGQVSVNYHLAHSLATFSILYRHKPKNIEMKRTVIHTVVDGMASVLSKEQLNLLESLLTQTLDGYEVTPSVSEEEQQAKANAELLQAYLSAKKIEGCSEKTICYYQSTINTLFAVVRKPVCDVTTNDIRNYLSDYQEQRKVSRVTIDNMRRIFSSFFAWLEDEDFIVKSPVRRIHRVRTESLVKEVLTDENMEVLRDSCQEIRDIAMIDLLASTGMRVGELVNLNREDIDFHERQCVVFGKGNKEREVYFNARTKIHLQNYLNSRTDDNPALFVSLSNPHSRLSISGVEVRLRMLGRKANIAKVHPHKFRRTLATMAIDKGMPIEQVQRLLGHVKIDTTLHYAMVNQNNVKMAHRKYIG